MNKQILIVEDEQDIANVFKKQLLFEGGYDVDLAGDGGEALEKMEKKQYDLVLLDLVMVPVDGVTVMKTLKAEGSKYRNTNVIALTNVTAESTKRELLELGVKKFLVKTDIDLVAEIKSFFNRTS